MARLTLTLQDDTFYAQDLAEGVEYVDEDGQFTDEACDTLMTLAAWLPGGLHDGSRHDMAQAIRGMARSMMAAAEVWNNAVLADPESQDGTPLLTMSLDELAHEWYAQADALEGVDDGR